MRVQISHYPALDLFWKRKTSTDDACRLQLVLTRMMLSTAKVVGERQAESLLLFPGLMFKLCVY